MMQRKFGMIIAFLLATNVTPVFAEPATGFTAEQKAFVADRVKALSREEQKQLRKDPEARRTFVQNTVKEMSPEDRAHFKEVWANSNQEQRKELFRTYRDKRIEKRQSRKEQAEIQQDSPN